jgi:CheY-like chemotaxis protein
MQGIVSFVQANKSLFDVAQAISSIVNLFAWLLALALLVAALRKNRIDALSVGPFSFRMAKEEAIVATAAASRAWQAISGGQVNVSRIRQTLDRAFTPKTAEHLTGKAVLWADDNPANNELAVRAFTKLGLDIVQAASTEAAIEALQRRNFDLVISDMGRGEDLRAGYDLLGRIRASGNKVPFFVFAGSDKPEYRKEAAERGAQLSTNDMLELVDRVVKTLGETP